MIVAKTGCTNDKQTPMNEDAREYELSPIRIPANTVRP